MVLVLFFGGGPVEPPNAMELLRGMAYAEQHQKDELAAQHRELESQRKQVELKIRNKKLKDDRLMRKAFPFFFVRRALLSAAACLRS